MEIKFNKKLFNPLYWHIRKYTHDPKIRFVLIYGGSSAAKTYSVTQSTIYDTLCEADRYMVCRKVGSDIEDSIYSDFVGIINNWNLGKFFTCIKNKIDNISGAYIRFRGLDDSEKIKGISRFKRVILEELSQFTHEDFKQVRKRLRGRPGQQIIAMWNPISEEHWIKKEIIDTQTWIDLPKEIDGIDYSKLSDESFVRINEEGNTILIKTTYMDNFWVVGHPELSNVGFKDTHTIADFEFDRKHDYPYYRVYALGEWGKLDTGAEFYKAFNVSHSVKPTGYNPELPLHLSFDENVNPYVSCAIWQAEGLNAWQIDEIALESPRNTLEHTITEFRKRYVGHRAGMFVYGDATSRKADAKLQKGYNFFSLITNDLQEYNPQTRVPLSNPPVMVRGMFINQIFSGRFEINVTIGENCKKTIEDVRYVKEASDGTKLKEKVKDPKTGVTYEKYGHLSDTMDYFLCFYFSDQFNSFKNRDSTDKRIAMRASDGIEY
jgi:phage terminase large subunit